MRQFTPTEKQQLDVKIEEEQELQERSPNSAEGSKETSAVTDFISSFWKYGFLALILCLLAYGLFILFKSGKFEYDEYGGLMIALMLLFNHVAYYFTTKGWKSIVMKTVAWVWIVFVFVYLFWIT